MVIIFNAHKYHHISSLHKVRNCSKPLLLMNFDMCSFIIENKYDFLQQMNEGVKIVFDIRIVVVYNVSFGFTYLRYSVD